MTTRHVEHFIDIDVPASGVYTTLADVQNWPRVFPPTVHVDHIERGRHEERIRIWAIANGTTKTWTSRRELKPDRLWIGFRQEVSAFPVAAMSGSWHVLPLTEHTSRVLLSHDYRAVDDDADHLAWIDRAVEENSHSELAALKANTELATADAELLLSFTDQVASTGVPKDMYHFVNEANLWRERLPHVTAVELREDIPGLQTLRMETVTEDGGRHLTESARVCFPHRRIVYKQTTLPALLSLHTGFWRFTEEDDGTTIAVAQHTVVLRRDRIASVLGADATVADARAFVRDALGANSRATLEYARAYAESQS